MQEFPLTATVVVPTLTVPQEQLELGDCLLGCTTTSPLSISNATNSGLLWEAEPSDGTATYLSVMLWRETLHLQQTA